MLITIVHSTLVKSVYSDRPLFKLSQEALTPLFGYPWDVALSPCILEAKNVTILNKYVANIIIYFPSRSTTKWTVVLLKISTLAKSSKIAITSWLLVWLLRLDHVFRWNSLPLRGIDLLNHCEDFINSLNWDFTLDNVGPIQAVNAIRSKYSTLSLYNFLLTKPLLHKTAKFSLYITNFSHKVIQFMKFISASLSMEIIPNMLDILELGHLEDSYQRLGQLVLIWLALAHQIDHYHPLILVKNVFQMTIESIFS